MGGATLRVVLVVVRGSRRMMPAQVVAASDAAAAAAAERSPRCAGAEEEGEPDRGVEECVNEKAGPDGTERQAVEDITRVIEIIRKPPVAHAVDVG